MSEQQKSSLPVQYAVARIMAAQTTLTEGYVENLILSTVGNGDYPSAVEFAGVLCQLMGPGRGHKPLLVQNAIHEQGWYIAIAETLLRSLRDYQHGGILKTNPITSTEPPVTRDAAA